MDLAIFDRGIYRCSRGGTRCRWARDRSIHMGVSFGFDTIALKRDGAQTPTNDLITVLQQFLACFRWKLDALRIFSC